MTANVCGRERRIRGIVGVILIIVGFIIGGNALGWIVGIVGLVLLLTGILSYCPINSLTGRNSCRVYTRDPLRDHEMTY